MHSRDDALTDIFDRNQTPIMLIDEVANATGITLHRYLHYGTMAAVMAGTFNRDPGINAVLPSCPRRIAVKLSRPNITRAITEQRIMNVNEFFERNAKIRELIAQNSLPPDYILGVYGLGTTKLVWQNEPMVIAWLAMEYVDGGPEGTTLKQRLSRCFDPVRVLHISSKLIQGLSTLHRLNIWHRDLKPENILISGPVDDETPKIADLDNVRINGVQTWGLNPHTPEYCGPEQHLMGVMGNQENPLLGPWSDVHALSATFWFMIARQEWHEAVGRADWMRGIRRGLPRDAQNPIHEGFLLGGQALLDEISNVLCRGAACRLPEEAWDGGGRRYYDYPMFAPLREGQVRYANIESFWQALEPLLQEAADKWTRYRLGAGQAPTLVRPTQVGIHQVDGQFNIEETANTNINIQPQLRLRSVAFDAEGNALVHVGPRLVHFVQGEPVRDLPNAEGVGPDPMIVRGPSGEGFALVGPDRVLLMPGNNELRLPENVGPVVLAVGSCRKFGVVARSQDDELALLRAQKNSERKIDWQRPIFIEAKITPKTISVGPFGWLLAGTSPRGEGKVITVRDEEIAIPTARGLPPLLAAVCSATSPNAWVSGGGGIWQLNGGNFIKEDSPEGVEPVLMAIDPVDTPWLLGSHVLLRRTLYGGQPRWETCYRRERARPPLVALGFTFEGAILLDEQGAVVRVAPPDVNVWKELRASLYAPQDNLTALSQS